MCIVEMHARHANIIYKDNIVALIIKKILLYLQAKTWIFCSKLISLIRAIQAITTQSERQSPKYDISDILKYLNITQ